MFHFIFNNRLLKRIVKVVFIYGSLFLFNVILGSLFLLEALGNTFGLDLETCGGFLICILPQPTLLGFLVLIVLSILMGLLFQECIRCIKQKKILRMFIILGITISFVGGFVIASPFIRRTISDMKSESRLRDAEYYKREYLETGEPTSSQQFIYARDNRIMVSEMDGKNDYLFKAVPLDENVKISSVSPGGTYYIATSINNGQSSATDANQLSEVRTVADDTFMISIISPEFFTDGGVRQVKLDGRCKWSFDEQFLACRYYKEGPKQLMLFDVARGIEIPLYDDSSLGGTIEDFTWSDTTLDFFYDHYDQDEKIYHIDNIKEMSESGFIVPPHRVLLDNLTPCVAVGAYQNNTIYCVTTTKELPGYKALPKNEFLATNDGLIIAYRAEENESESPIVVTKAPFFDADDSPTLYPIDATYLAVHLKNSGFLLVNTKTGRANLGAIYYTSSGMMSPPITIDTNIFYNAREGTAPVPYTGAF